VLEARSLWLVYYRLRRYFLYFDMTIEEIYLTEYIGQLIRVVLNDKDTRYDKESLINVYLRSLHILDSTIIFTVYLTSDNQQLHLSLLLKHPYHPFLLVLVRLLTSLCLTSKCVPLALFSR
jgi:hypothetical protein